MLNVAKRCRQLRHSGSFVLLCHVVCRQKDFLFIIGKEDERESLKGLQKQIYSTKAEVISLTDCSQINF